MSDQVLGNMMLWDGSAPRPSPVTIRVRNGRVVRVAPAIAGPVDVDFGGAVVTPGLVDAHLHLMLGGESCMRADLSAATGRADFEAVVAAAHEELPPDRWLVASGWNETRWPDGGLPDATWLACAGERPVVCWRCDWHAALVSPSVMAMLDLSSPPPGGQVVRGPGGAPTGLFLEAAAWKLINPLVPAIPEDERATALDAGMRHLLESGVTMARTMEYRADVERHYLPRLGDLPVKLSVVQLDRDLPLDLDWMSDVPRSDRFHVRSCKAFLDGTLGSRTARLHEPYADDPAARGMWVELALAGRDQEWLDAVLDAGCSPVMHAIGDAAVARALELQRRHPAMCTIEHAEVISRAELDAMEGARLSVQPTHRAEDAAMARDRLGGRAEGLLPLRSMQRRGAILSFGTDWPISPVDPVRTLRAAITGEDIQGRPFHADEALSPHDAFVAATIEAAATCGYARPLSAGAPCDLAVWDGDPFEDIHAATVQATIVDGTLVAGSLPTPQPHQRGTAP